MKTCEGYIMYRYTEKKAKRDKICRRMRQGKEEKRLALAAELGPRPPTYQPPKLRRVVVVMDFDLGFKIDVFRLWRRNKQRIDSYRISHNDKDAGRMGWSNFCKKLSTHYPRVLSPYAGESQ